MATNSTLPPPLPNPYTTLAFLPPSFADQFEASIYVYVATLSAFVWDWLMSLPDEIKMCQKRSGVRPAVVAYFTSRIGTLGYLVIAVVFQAAPVAHCDVLLYAIGVFFILAVPATCTLFFLRVRAVYDNKYVTAFFAFLLLGVLGVSCTIPASIKGAHIGTTQRCIITEYKSFGSLPGILNAVFDTLVFVAISLRMVSLSIVGNTPRARMWFFFRGDGLPSFSRSLLQGGQLYYFLTIGFNIMIAAMIYAPVPPVFHGMFAVPNIALENAMACRVCRGLSLGLLEDKCESASQLTTPRFGQQPTVMASSTKEQPIKMHSFDNSPRCAVTVEVTKTTDVEPFQGPRGRYDENGDDRSESGSDRV